MDLHLFGGSDCLEVRRPECIHLALNRVISFEQESGDLKTAADICESLLLTGMILFGSKDPANRSCCLYLAGLWQQLGISREALILNYVTLVNGVSLLDADSLEIRLRMVELMFDLNANSQSELIINVNILLAEELLADVLAELIPNHSLILRVQRQVIRSQSQQMDLKWTLQKYQEILKVAKETIDYENCFIEETSRIMAHNLQDVMLKMNEELDQKTIKTEIQPLNDKPSTELGITSTSCEENANIQIPNELTSTENNVSTYPDKDLFLRKSLTAASLLAQGKLHLAVQLYQELLFYTSSSFGDTDQTTLCTKQTLAAILDQQGRFDEALRNYKETLTTAHSALGYNHRVTKIARKQMETLNKKLKRLNVIYSYYTHERLKSDWFNRIFVMIMAGFLLWLLVEVYFDHVR